MPKRLTTKKLEVKLKTNYDEFDKIAMCFAPNFRIIDNMY